jgi:hypothetical protein
MDLHPLPLDSSVYGKKAQKKPAYVAKRPVLRAKSAQSLCPLLHSALDFVVLTYMMREGFGNFFAPRRAIVHIVEAVPDFVQQDVVQDVVLGESLSSRNHSLSTLPIGSELKAFLREADLAYGHHSAIRLFGNR